MPNQPPYTPVTPEKKGLSGCAIAAIIVGVLGLIVVGLGIWAVMKFKDNVTTDPAKVNVMASKIAEIELGEKWKPQLYMDILVVRMAIYTSDDARGLAMLMDGDSKMAAGEEFETQMRAEMEKSTQKNGANTEKTTQISSARQDFMVRGEAESFLVVNSEGNGTKNKYIEVSGTFESATSGRTAFLMIKSPEEYFSMDEIKAAIESIK